MNWSKIDNLIFDVDGTLYSQNKVRVNMFFRLIVFYGINFYRLKELYALYYFRKIREKKEYKNCTMNELYKVVSHKCSLDVSLIKNIIKKWMFIEPIKLLRKYKYKEVIDFINNQYKLGKKIVIYSDYPAIEKLEALNISFSMVFVSGENELFEQKPSIECMQKILSIANIDSSKTVYVGDRNDKDRISAKYVNIEYFDIKKFRKLINKL